MILVKYGPTFGGPTSVLKARMKNFGFNNGD